MQPNDEPKMTECRECGIPKLDLQGPGEPMPRVTVMTAFMRWLYSEMGPGRTYEEEIIEGTDRVFTFDAEGAAGVVQFRIGIGIWEMFLEDHNGKRHVGQGGNLS